MLEGEFRLAIRKWINRVIVRDLPLLSLAQSLLHVLQSIPDEVLLLHRLLDQFIALLRDLLGGHRFCDRGHECELVVVVILCLDGHIDGRVLVGLLLLHFGHFEWVDREESVKPRNENNATRAFVDFGIECINFTVYTLTFSLA